MHAFNGENIRSVYQRPSRNIDLNQGSFIRPDYSERILFTIGASVCAGVAVLPDGTQSAPGMMHVFAHNLDYPLGRSGFATYARSIWQGFAVHLDPTESYTAVLFGGQRPDVDSPLPPTQDVAGHFKALAYFTGVNSTAQYLSLFRGFAAGECSEALKDLEALGTPSTDARSPLVARHARNSLDPSRREEFIGAYFAYMGAGGRDLDWNLALRCSEWLGLGLRQAIATTPCIKTIHDFGLRSEIHDAFIDAENRTIVVRLNEPFDISHYNTTYDASAIVDIPPPLPAGHRSPPGNEPPLPRP